MVIDPLRSKSPQLPVNIDGVDTEVFSGSGYLVVHLNDKLDGSFNTTKDLSNGQRDSQLTRKVFDILAKP